MERERRIPPGQPVVMGGRPLKEMAAPGLAEAADRLTTGLAETTV